MYLCLLQNGEDVIRDALVIMSKTGDIYVGVLGTEPSLFSAPRPEARQVNYEETDIEMASLNTIIKTAQTADEGKHTCPRVIIKGANFRSSEGGTKKKIELPKCSCNSLNLELLNDFFLNFKIQVSRLRPQMF